MLKYFVVLLCSAVLASGAMLLKNYDNRGLRGWVMSEKTMVCVPFGMAKSCSLAKIRHFAPQRAF